MDPELLKILACPLCGGALEYDPGRRELVSPEAGVAYPVVDGIPVLCPETARPLGADQAPAGESGVEKKKVDPGLKPSALFYTDSGTDPGTDTT